MYTIPVSRHYQRCGIREKGKDFYKKLLDLIPEDEADIQFDFKGVTFVSSSFLEESIFRLIEKYNVSVVERSKLIERKAARLIRWKNLNIEMNYDKGVLRFRTP